MIRLKKAVNPLSDIYLSESIEFLMKKELLDLKKSLFDHLNSLQSQYPSIGPSGPNRRKFSFQMAVEPNGSSETVMELRLNYNPEFVMKNLLRKSLVHGLHVKEWFLLFELTEQRSRNSNSDPFLIAVSTLVLSLLSATRMGSSSWNTEFRPIKGSLKLILQANVEVRTIDNCPFTLLESKLPERYLENLFSWSVFSRQIPKPTEVRTIGVGYKDKGNLPEDHKWLPKSGTYEESKDDLQLKISLILKISFKIIELLKSAGKHFST